MDLRLLGPLDLWLDGRRIDPGAAKQRCVLAVLGLSAGTAVTAEALIDRVWGDTPPTGVRGALHTYVARLRKLLGTSTDGSPVLRRDHGGYLLGIEPEQVDVLRFRGLIARSERAPDTPSRSEFLYEALTLWRGTPLSGVPGDWADSVRMGLSQLRLDALLQRVDLDLERGQISGLADELTNVLAEHPLSERLAARLMLTLYRTGRVADALGVFDRMRRRLSDELGNDPGPELQSLHRRVLRHDSALDAAPGQSSVQPPDVPRQLPIAPTIFVGRTVEFERAVADLTRETRSAPPIVAVYGPGGVGKSALALRTAHAVAGHFPDGQLYLDLHGASPGATQLSPAEGLSRVLQGLGVPTSAVPADPDAAAARFRSLLADKRVLVVLDNAANSHQVRPLLPAGPKCGVVVTSPAQ